MTVRFGGIVSHHIGGGWGTETPNPTSDTPAYVIRGTDIPRVAVGDLRSVPLRFHKSSNLASRSLQAGDIVFEVSGGSKGQPVGRALYVTDELLARFDHPVMCASFCKLVRIDPELAVPAYVFRDLQLGYRDGRLESFQVQSTGITNFKWKPFLEHFDVSLPPVGIQRRVAEVLTSMDDLIEKNWRRIEVLEEMARAIYREWFVKLRFPGHQDVPIVDSPLGPVPEGWQVCQLGDISSVLARGIAPKYSEDGEWRVINQRCIRDGRVTLDLARRHGRGVAGAKQVRPGDVLINSTGVGTLGRVGVYRGPREGVTVDSHVTICRATDEAYVCWYGMSLMSEQPTLERLGTGATGQTELRRSDVEQLSLAQPSRPVAQAFAELIDPMHKTGNILAGQISALSAARDLLLPKLVTGQIDVSGLDLDAVVAKEVVG
ncbi:restriction endonuclease subunit S [Actinomyces sp. oral taxon 175]|uniref:restriction endonuclease subunit S n=1 Tax=Actinomyces sp. oral taxon 175 TaxID=712119 RepID=UPI001112067D|nr:restriction endonuclease subunit S [Actinomyces sp. oral taxon 175]